MQGFKDILDSQHGIIGVGLIIAATVLTIVGVMPLEDWKTYTQVIFIGVAGTHAAISVGNSLADRGQINPATLDHPTVKTLIDAIVSSMNKPDETQPVSKPAIAVIPAVIPPKTETV